MSEDLSWVGEIVDGSRLEFQESFSWQWLSGSVCLSRRKGVRNELVTVSV